MGEVAEMTDIVRLGLSAGLSFDASLSLYCEGRSGELAQLMEKALFCWQVGVTSRDEALDRVAQDAGVRALGSFAAAVSQALELGAPLAETLEGQLLRLADKIAYINHDIDDAIRGRIIYPMDIPLSISQVLGFTHSERINTLTVDIITQSAGRDAILQSPACRDAMGELRAFMFEFVYRNPVAKGEEGKAQELLRRLFDYYRREPDKLPPEFQDIRMEEGVERAVCDYIAGMTDVYAVECFNAAFIPKSWSVK